MARSRTSGRNAREPRPRVARAFPDGAKGPFELGALDILRENWYRLCDPATPAAVKSLLRDSIEADFRCEQPWYVGQLDVDSLQRGGDSYVVVGVMVRGFTCAARAYRELDSGGKAIGFALAGYSSGLYTVPHIDARYALGRVHIPEPYLEFLRDNRREKVLITDHMLVTGETVKAVAGKLRSEGVKDIYLKCNLYTGPKEKGGATYFLDICRDARVKWHC
jgi:hypothetical protein